MRPTWKLVLVAGAALLLSGAAVLAGRVAAGSVSPPDPGKAPGAGPPATLEVRARGNLSLAEAEHFGEYPLYFAGRSFRGLPLVAVDRARAPEPLPGEPTRNDNVGFLYGSCELELDEDGYAHGGCPAPLEIQVWPVCRRWQEMYAVAPDEELRLRGVAAAFFEGHRRLELYTRAVTIVVFGRSREELLAAAAGLRGVNNPHAPGAGLTAPGQGGAPVSCHNEAG